MTLDQLGIKHGTDKNSTAHDYLSFYEEIFPSPTTMDLKILEIGVNGGASINLWLEWFFSGRVYGIDHNLKWKKEHARLVLLEGDVTDRAFMDGVVKEHGRWDIIIDDGGHHTGQKLAAIAALWPSLRPGGFYVIEDGHVDYADAWTNEGTHRFNPIVFDWIDVVVNERGRLMMGRRLGMDSGTGSIIDGVDTITFRKSLIVLRKRVV